MHGGPADISCIEISALKKNISRGFLDAGLGSAKDTGDTHSLFAARALSGVTDHEVCVKQCPHFVVKGGELAACR